MTTAKKAAPRKRAVSGAKAGEGPTERTVITTEGTTVVPVSDEPINAPDALTEVTGNERKPDADTVVTPGPVAEDTTKEFNGLEPDELKEVALFFQKDVVVSDPEKGPSKNELLAALASGDEDDEPVSWSDYTNIYLSAQAPKRAPAQTAAANVNDQAERQTLEDVNAAVQTEEPMVLIKMERKNPRYDIAGYRFTADHPFQSVPEKTAEFIVRQTGFRLAMPSEVTDYYS